MCPYHIILIITNNIRVACFHLRCKCLYYHAFWTCLIPGIDRLSPNHQETDGPSSYKVSNSHPIQPYPKRSKLLLTLTSFSPGGKGVVMFSFSLLPHRISIWGRDGKGIIDNWLGWCSVPYLLCFVDSVRVSFQNTEKLGHCMQPGMLPQCGVWEEQVKENRETVEKE